MTTCRLLGRTLLAATAISAASIATPAAAQRVDNIVAFGDSYADDGNLFQIIGFNPAPGSCGPAPTLSGIRRSSGRSRAR